MVIPTDQIPRLITSKESTLIVLGIFETLVLWRTLLMEQLQQLHEDLRKVQGFQGAQILLNQHDPGIVVIQFWCSADTYEQAYQLPSIEQHIQSCQHWSLSIIWTSYQTHQVQAQEEG